MSAPPNERVETHRGETPLPQFETAQRRLFGAYGLDPQSRFADLGRPPIRTQLLELGATDADPPVVFVHGTGAFGAFFAPLMAHFDDERLISFDRPGYGLSGAFRYTEATIRETVVDVLVGVLDELDIDRADIVGHSMGGQAGILFARAHPDRVRRLTLLGSVPGFPGTAPPLPIRLLTVPVLNRLLRRLQRSGTDGVLDIADVFGERDAIQAHPAVIEAMASHEADPKAADAGFSEFNALISIRGWRSSIRLNADELGDVHAPTTSICGEHDTLGEPDDVRAGVESIANVRFETVDAGHIPFFAHPERCAQLIRE